AVAVDEDSDATRLTPDSPLKIGPGDQDLGQHGRQLDAERAEGDTADPALCLHDASRLDRDNLPEERQREGQPSDAGHYPLNDKCPGVDQCLDLRDVGLQWYVPPFLLISGPKDAARAPAVALCSRGSRPTEC